MLTKKQQNILIFLRLEGKKRALELRDIYTSPYSQYTATAHLLRCGWIRKIPDKIKPKKVHYDLTKEGKQLANLLLMSPEYEKKLKRLKDE